MDSFEDLTLCQLLKHVLIKEETRYCGHKLASKSSTNVHNIESSIRNNNRNYTGRKNKRKFDATTSNDKIFQTRPQG